MYFFKRRVFPLILGVLLAWASIAIIGIGAAVAIPGSVLKPLMTFSPQLALTLIDLFTIALPLAAAFIVVILASRLVQKKPDTLFYLLLLAPLLCFQVYLLLGPSQQLMAAALTTLPRYIVLAVCVYWLTRSNQQVKA
ncbi:MAG: hypothetical protein CML20_00110 [Rheinheimera sp.]|uniref:hypothetical protein n=1 Tax=Arsukibacterium sp. UBA3155 TaxID=1946058 RepID=UPI000C8CF7A8|nr:hypothetical protein [Arsukibacterium sp. UBA3155]MAD73208.1 hypothetical protein [Rheinheimera sp.]